MKGYGIWRNALLDMTNPVTELDQGILKEVTQNFIDDILAGLTADDLSEVEIYNFNTAINGVAGLKYVDKMNRKTSMGFPWKKSKKHFIHKVPAQPNVPDPVEFCDEVVQRSEAILTNYKRGLS